MSRCTRITILSLVEGVEQAVDISGYAQRCFPDYTCSSKYRIDHNQSYRILNYHRFRASIHPVDYVTGMERRGAANFIMACEGIETGALMV